MDYLAKLKEMYRSKEEQETINYTNLNFEGPRLIGFRDTVKFMKYCSENARSYMITENFRDFLVDNKGECLWGDNVDWKTFAEIFSKNSTETELSEIFSLCVYLFSHVRGLTPALFEKYFVSRKQFLLNTPKVNIMG